MAVEFEKKYTKNSFSWYPYTSLKRLEIFASKMLQQSQISPVPRIELKHLIFSEGCVNTDTLCNGIYITKKS